MTWLRAASSLWPEGALGFAIGVLAAGCALDASHANRCGPAGECPEGRSCHEGFCVLREEGSVEPATSPEAGMEPATARPDGGATRPDGGAPDEEPCPGGECAVPQTCSSSNCEPSCEAPGAQCALDCAGASNCDAHCARDTSCAVRCAETSNCELKCHGDCTLACEETSNCRAECTAGGSCDIACPAGGNCEKLRCKDGAACVLRCAHDEKCEFEKCEGREISCSPTLKVCNRSCP